MNIHDELGRAVETAETDLERLGRVARGQGTRLRRRRQGLAVLGTAAVVAALVGGGGALLGRGPDTDPVAADPTIGTTAPTSPAPSNPASPDSGGPASPSAGTSATPDPTPDLTTVVPLTGAGVVAALRYAVEGQESGDASEYAGQGSPGSFGAYGELAWSDQESAGISVIGINVQPRMEFISTCEPGYTLRCTESTLPDGARLTTYEEETAVEGGSGIRRVADLLRADGTRIVVASTNGRDQPSNGWDITRPQPALTYDQLVAIAREPWWGARIPAVFVDEGADLPGYVDLEDDIIGADPS